MAQYGQEKLRQPTLHWECDSDRVNLHRTFSLPRDEKKENPSPYQGSCEKESKRDVCRIGKQLIYFILKVHIFWEGHKILQNLHQLFDWQYTGQIIGGDFAKFCGLLRIYELYLSH